MEEFVDQSHKFDEEQYRFNRSKKFVKVLCILSFISIGFGIIGALGNLAVGKQSIEQYEDTEAILYGTYADMGIDLENFPSVITALEFQKHVNFESFYINILLAIVALSAGLFGVLKMLKMEKKGYHFYIVYCALPLITFFVVAPLDLIHWTFFAGPIFTSALFLILYGVNVKHMK